MWWTKKARKAPKAYAETLEERMELLEATQRTLKTEWLDVYDKLYRLAGRLDSSRRWAGEKTPPQGTADAPSGPENGTEATTVEAAQSAAPPVARMSRAELLQSMMAK